MNLFLNIMLHRRDEPFDDLIHDALRSPSGATRGEASDDHLGLNVMMPFLDFTSTRELIEHGIRRRPAILRDLSQGVQDSVKISCRRKLIESAADSVLGDVTWVFYAEGRPLGIDTRLVRLLGEKWVPEHDARGNAPSCKQRWQVYFQPGQYDEVGRRRVDEEHAPLSQVEVYRWSGENDAPPIAGGADHGSLG